eukprot:CAMPEP_0174829074 /NCGR_PEP_ID=MMETSP1114-20130205/1714_1 /TAXON_ID=312471 /ORGANISM="Neobodo designis, Strain CCAP 1951/1" /LENGTH=71 /DNA_ID=CAMNT_0016062815 /DNA_START=37 /DNA_END=249 /DNA_ORIENTATION=+
MPPKTKRERGQAPQAARDEAVVRAQQVLSSRAAAVAAEISELEAKRAELLRDRDDIDRLIAEAEARDAAGG